MLIFVKACDATGQVGSKACGSGVYVRCFVFVVVVAQHHRTPHADYVELTGAPACSCKGGAPNTKAWTDSQAGPRYIPGRAASTAQCSWLGAIAEHTVCGLILATLTLVSVRGSNGIGAYLVARRRPLRNFRRDDVGDTFGRRHDGFQVVGTFGLLRG